MRPPFLPINGCQNNQTTKFGSKSKIRARQLWSPIKTTHIWLLQKWQQQLTKRRIETVSALSAAENRLRKHRKWVNFFIVAALMCVCRIARQVFSQSITRHLTLSHETRNFFTAAFFFEFASVTASLICWTQQGIFSFESSNKKVYYKLSIF